MERNNITPEQIEHIAEEVAKKTVERLLLSLGLNASDPTEVPKFQKDLAHLRSWRESTEAIQRRGLLAAVTVVVTAGIGWVMTLLFRGHQ